MKKMKALIILQRKTNLNIFVAIFTLLFINLLNGCAVIKEGVRSVGGVSVKMLEKERKNALVKTIAYDYSASYARTVEILKHLNAYIYMQDIKKQMIAIYLSEQDTTPVGLFFKEIDRNHTQIEVSSPSVYAKETIFAKLISSLEKQ